VWITYKHRCGTNSPIINGKAVKKTSLGPKGSPWLTLPIAAKAMSARRSPPISSAIRLQESSDACHHLHTNMDIILNKTVVIHSIENGLLFTLLVKHVVF
jgi:hypothetical protein